MIMYDFTEDELHIGNDIYPVFDTATNNATGFFSFGVFFDNGDPTLLTDAHANDEEINFRTAIIGDAPARISSLSHETYDGRILTRIGIRRIRENDQLIAIPIR